jgi:hypothetical protein
MAISSAIMAITTSSSINVKPFRSHMMFALLFQREVMSFAGMLFCHNYNTLVLSNASQQIVKLLRCGGRGKRDITQELDD